MKPEINKTGNYQFTIIVPVYNEEEGIAQLAGKQRNHRAKPQQYYPVWKLSAHHSGDDKRKHGFD